MEYIIPKSWVDATAQEKKDIANGCGAGWKQFDNWFARTFYKLLNKAIPDTIYGLNISQICGWHDFDYTFLEKTKKNKDKADRDFRHNLKVKVKDHGGRLEWLRLKRVEKYYYFVSEHGDAAFFG